ncbi:alpha/beta hydrolase [Phenylobacterium sp.]|uniref:alpha/beta fold hydrolase n=1 Tax=Phenylobacterium sp. TaxID=1871053 RepID=UPI00120E4F58|nr:alpha/beta hydrolase [Phenylobacterium sp.]THD65415.1 MAG: alpha/beta hydrolase [Phenylobacterium sp.]
MKRMFLGVALVLIVWISAGAAMVATAGPFTPSGRYVDIGGRKLRLVCAGPPADAARPTVWMEPGAFGLAADWAAIQEKLTVKSIRSCAYDRAGMGWSDPGPKPRDAATITDDLEKLIAASGEPGPFILMGHSMAGLYTRLFAGRDPDKVAGLVLIEATTPEQIDNPGTQKFIGVFTTISKVAAVSASLGTTLPLYWSAGDRIGLPKQGSAEKRHAYVSGRHARTAAEEVENWPRSAAEAGKAAPYDPKWPVAVIVADRGETQGSTDARRGPELASRAGTFEAVRGASHTSILGETYGDAAVRGVEFVLAHLAPSSSGL